LEDGDGKRDGRVRGDERDRCFSGFFRICRTAPAWQSDYPLDEILLCVCLRCWVSRHIVDIARFGEKNLIFCDGFGRFRMERRLTITSAIFFATLDAEKFQRCSWPGWRR